MRTFRWGAIREVGNVLLGSFVAGCGFAIVWANRGRPFPLGLMMVVAGLVGTGAFVGALRMPFIVDPERHRCVREIRLFGVTLSRTAWSFHELAAVDLLVEPRTRGQRAATIYLVPVNDRDPIQVKDYPMGALVPPLAIQEDHELAALIGLPFRRRSSP